APACLPCGARHGGRARGLGGRAGNEGGRISHDLQEAALRGFSCSSPYKGEEQPMPRVLACVEPLHRKWRFLLVYPTVGTVLPGLPGITLFLASSGMAAMPSAF